MLVAVNGQPVKDVFDYHYLINEEYLEILVRKADGEEWELEIEKEYEDDLGIEFENGMMDDYRSCSNKCIFCFIDQLPKGMRRPCISMTRFSAFFFAGQLCDPYQYE